MPDGTMFFSLERGGETLAIATSVRDNGWSGIIKLLMRGIAEFCLEKKASRLYLQVVADNEPAVRLYKRLGFTPVCGYHDRSKPIPTP